MAFDNRCTSLFFHHFGRTDRVGHEKCVAFHASFMTFVDHECEWIIFRPFSALSGKNGRYRFYLRAVNHIASQPGLYKNRIEVGFLQTIQDGTQFLLLPVSFGFVRCRTCRPVEAKDRRQPYGTNFVFGVVVICGRQTAGPDTPPQ